MQALRLPAARGLHWIVQGWRLYYRNPPLLVLLALNYWLLFFLVFLIPFAGPAAANIALQALSVTVMNGCRAIDEGTRVAADITWSGFRRNLPTLLKLGGLYLLGELAIAGILLAVFGASPTELLSIGKATPEPAADKSLIPILFAALGLTLPLVLAFWFAPILAAWQNLGALKAVFFSAVAVSRNWRAFALYGAAAMSLAIVLPSLLRAATQFSDAAATAGSLAATILMILVLMPTLFASVYVSYREVFAPPTGDAGSD